MVKSGNYEVDDEGNLVEVDAGDAARVGGGAGPGAPLSATETPAPVRRALRTYRLAQLVSVAILVAMIVAMPDIRGILVLFTTLWIVASFLLGRLYRYGLLRGYS